MRAFLIVLWILSDVAAHGAWGDVAASEPPRHGRVAQVAPAADAAAAMPARDGAEPQPFAWAIAPPAQDGCPEANDALHAIALANQHLQGVGAAKDPAKARACLVKAAHSNNTRAQLELSLYLLNGIGGPVDSFGAAAWLWRAKSSGSEQAGALWNQLVGRNAAADFTRGSTDIPKKLDSYQSARLVFLATILLIWAWLAIGNRSPWPWRWGRQNSI